jgi:hypothetical protein
MYMTLSSTTGAGFVTVCPPELTTSKYLNLKSQWFAPAGSGVELAIPYLPQVTATKAATGTIITETGSTTRAQVALNPIPRGANGVLMPGDSIIFLCQDETKANSAQLLYWCLYEDIPAGLPYNYYPIIVQTNQCCSVGPVKMINMRGKTTTQTYNWTGGACV